MFKLKILFFTVFMSTLSVLSQINVGPAINNLNSRVFVLENKQITVEEILNLGFITNEVDKIALEKIGDLTLLETDSKTNLVSAINEVNGKAMYPVRIYDSTTNNYIEFSGNDVIIFTNGVANSQVATTNDLVILQENIYQYLNNQSLSRYVTTNSYLSAYSNQIYHVTASNNVVFNTPESYTDKESKITLHLYKGTGAVTFFPNITWIYGESPQFEVTNKTYVFQFESINGLDWRGYIEYVY